MSKTLDYIALIVVFIGAVNWGLIGLFRAAHSHNPVSFLFYYVCVSDSTVPSPFHPEHVHPHLNTAMPRCKMNR